MNKYPCAAKEAYCNLAAAIIEQAVNDYCDARSRLRKIRRLEIKDVEIECKAYASRKEIQDVRKFMHSQWFENLTENINGPVLFRKLEEMEDNKDAEC